MIGNNDKNFPMENILLKIARIFHLNLELKITLKLNKKWPMFRQLHLFSLIRII